MAFRTLIELYQTWWMFKSNAQQRLAWEDAAQARLARDKSERLAAEQLAAMLDANPSGQLGTSRLNDEERLKEAGLL